jgi:hypothetical protein
MGLSNYVFLLSYHALKEVLKRSHQVQNFKTPVQLKRENKGVGRERARSNRRKELKLRNKDVQRGAICSVG